MTTKRIRKARAKAPKRLGLRKETLKDLTVRRPGPMGGKARGIQSQNANTCD